MEHEAKFLLSDFLAMHNRLLAQSTLLLPWHLEKNYLYDQDDKLTNEGKLLRIRQTGQTNILTFKGPSVALEKNIKSRHELECQVDSAQVLENIFLGLGYHLKAGYEKFRSVWDLGCGKGYLDLLPFGCFLEIEANTKDISKLAHDLGLDFKLALADNYFSLYNKWCKTKGLEPSLDMVFELSEKKRLAHLLSCAEIF